MINKGNYQHGKSQTRLYHTFYGIKSRCYNTNNIEYKNYGAKGIKICDEWLNDKTKFFQWAETNGYNDELQIDRINNDGDYSPENCRWVTQQQNSWNRSCNTRNGSSKFKGVHWNKIEQRWASRINGPNGKIFLGYFDNEIDAAKTYDAKAKELRGEYAYLNFPGGE